MEEYNNILLSVSGKVGTGKTVLARIGAPGNCLDISANPAGLTSLSRFGPIALNHTRVRNFNELRALFQHFNSISGEASLDGYDSIYVDDYGVIFSDHERTLRAGRENHQLGYGFWGQLANDNMDLMSLADSLRIPVIFTSHLAEAKDGIRGGFWLPSVKQVELTLRKFSVAVHTGIRRNAPTDWKGCVLCDKTHSEYVMKDRYNVFQKEGPASIREHMRIAYLRGDCPVEWSYPPGFEWLADAVDWATDQIRGKVARAKYEVEIQKRWPDAPTEVLRWAIFDALSRVEIEDALDASKLRP